MTDPITPESELERRLEQIIAKWRDCAMSWEQKLAREAYRPSKHGEGLPPAYGKGSVRNWINWLRNCADEVEAALRDPAPAPGWLEYVDHKLKCASRQIRDFCRGHGGDGSINGCPTCQNIPRRPACDCGLAELLPHPPASRETPK